MGVGFVQRWGPRGRSNGRVQGRGQRGSQLQQGGQQKRRGWEQGKSFLCRGATGWPGRAGKAVATGRRAPLEAGPPRACRAAESATTAAQQPNANCFSGAVCKVIV